MAKNDIERDERVLRHDLFLREIATIMAHRTFNKLLLSQANEDIVLICKDMQSHYEHVCPNLKREN